MVNFGKQYLHMQGLSFFGRLGYYIYGHPHIAKYLQSYYFRKNVKKIISDKTRSVLDVGCGNGDYAFYLAEKYLAIEIDAIDVYRSNNETSKEVQEKTKLKNINFIHSDCLAYSFSKKYDLVYCVEMLHAVKDKKKLLKKISGLLAPNGFFYFQDCLNGSYEMNILSSQPLPFLAYKNDFFKGKQMTEEELVCLFRELNLTILKKQRIIGFFGQFAWEIDQYFQQMNFVRLRAFLMPFIKFLCLIDFLIPVGKKNEICIVAGK